MDTLFCPVTQKVPLARWLAHQSEASEELGSAKPDHRVKVGASFLTPRRLKVNTVVSPDGGRKTAARHKKLMGRSCRRAPGFQSRHVKMASQRLVWWSWYFYSSSAAAGNQRGAS